jgi:hypothetical protein
MFFKLIIAGVGTHSTHILWICDVYGLGKLMSRKRRIIKEKPFVQKDIKSI